MLTKMNVFLKWYLTSLPFFRLLWALPLLITSASGVAQEDERLQGGKALYLKMCAACHGEDGRGGGWGGPDLTPVVPRRSDGRLFAIIRAGIPGTGMRGTTMLTDEEIWAIVSYLRTLSP